MFQVKPNDKIYRIIPPTSGCAVERNEGEVVTVNDEEIICIVQVAHPRSMRFSRKDGRSLMFPEQFIIPR